MKGILTTSIVFFALLLTNQALAKSEQGESRVEMVGNQGVLIAHPVYNIWIDSVYEEINDWDNFTFKPVAERHSKMQLESSKPQLFLTTHIHRDHFHPFKLGSLLDKNKHAIFIGNSQTRESIFESYYNELRIQDRVRSMMADQWLSLGESFDNATVRALKSNHSNAHYSWVDNSVWEVKTASIYLMHLGDIDASDDVLQLLSNVEGKLDFLIIPFWILMNEALTNSLLSSDKVNKIIVSHIIPTLHDRIVQAVENYDNKKLILVPYES